VRGDEQAWFLTAADFAGDSGSAFAWHEWERLECDGADADEKARSHAFWSTHLPILQAVEGDYAYLAVRVDPASAQHGAVVRGQAPEFQETSTISPSFEALLKAIAAARNATPRDDLFDLLRSTGDETRVRDEQAASGPRSVFGRLLDGIRSWPLFERYRIGVVVEPALSRPLWRWENWSKIMPSLNVVMAGLGEPAFIRPRQAGDRDNWLRFGRLPWSEESNRTWTTRYLQDPTMAGKVSFVTNEVWAPSRAACEDRRHGPKLFCQLDRNQAVDEQGFLLAVRKDVLRRVDVAADDAIFEVRSLLPDSNCVMLDRSWGEHGRFGSPIVVNNLDWTQPETVMQWAKAHPRSRVPSFRWRRSMGGRR
jgi:hypothetical protein